MMWTSTNLATEIWLKFWTEANTEHPNTNTGMYFGVYAALGVIALFFLGADIWCVIRCSATTSC